MVVHSFLQVWYDGRGYHGSQYQPGLRTIDGAIIDALRGLGYIPRDDNHVDHFKVAGRTDKGVSALGAVYYIASLRPLHPPEINHALRAGGHAIQTRAVARLDRPLNPRDATTRVYKYVHVETSKSLDVDTISRALEVMVGEHEFKGFTKATIPPGTRTVRTVDVATVAAHDDTLVFTFTSKGFLWEQVRRMVAFVLDHHDDPDLPARVARVLATGEQPNVGPADPAGLILWEVQYGENIQWETIDDSAVLFERAATRRYATAKVQGLIASMARDAAMTGARMMRRKEG